MMLGYSTTYSSRWESFLNFELPLHIFNIHASFDLLYFFSDFIFHEAKAARLAVKAGVDGILVSAHGGRQLPGVQPPVSNPEYQSVSDEFHDFCLSS